LNPLGKQFVGRASELIPFATNVATQFLQSDYDIHTTQDLFGHPNILATIVCIHITKTRWTGRGSDSNQSKTYFLIVVTFGHSISTDDEDLAEKTD